MARAAVVRDAPGSVERKVVVPDFAPSSHGFRFDTRFSGIDVPLGRTSFVLRDRNVGLCGGMSFAARDLFESGRTRPPFADPPKRGPWLDYLVRRQWDSVLAPLTLLKFYYLMNPLLLDGERRLGLLSRAWWLAKREWPIIRSDLDRGKLCIVGLVRTTSWRLGQMRAHHIVVAHGYSERGDTILLHLYDPIYPGDDSIALRFAGDSGSAAFIDYGSPRKEKTICFFRIRYEPSIAPPLSAA